jgi:hypothetical protein
MRGVSFLLILMLLQPADAAVHFQFKFYRK